MFTFIDFELKFGEVEAKIIHNFLTLQIASLAAC